MTLNGNTYTSADGRSTRASCRSRACRASISSRIVSADGSIYGVATFKNDILALDIILGDPDPLAVAKAAGDPSLATLEAGGGEQGGIEVTSREQLDAVIQLYLDGKLALMGLVMYATDDPRRATPARIIYVDGEYREE